jgi:serine/threonine protein kinase
MEYWEATGPDGREVTVTVIPLHQEVLQEVREWFRGLPQLRRITHPHLLPLADLWLRTEDGRVLAELPPPRADSAPESAEQVPVEVIEIDAWSTRFRTVHERFRECRAQTRRGIPWRELMHYLEPVAEALDYLHQPVHDRGRGPAPIIHGDLKPQDLVLAEGTVRLAGWANLTRTQAFEMHRRVTQSGVIRTIAYAAPEAIAGAPVAGSDQYSLAVLYATFRTGALPYRKGTSPSEMLQLIRTGGLDFSRLPKPEQRVIHKAASLDPDKRWPTCSYLMQALRVAHDSPVGHRDVPPPGP